MDEDRLTSAVVVYDCGSITSDIPWISIEEKFIPQRHNQRIDLLFISHFHKDHISGVQHLLDNYSLGVVLLPVITTAFLAESYLYNVMEDRTIFSVSNTLMINLISGNNKYKIVSVNHPEILNIHIDGEQNIVDFSNLRNMLPGGYGIKFNDWIYIPYNHIGDLELKRFEYDLMNTYSGLYDAFDKRDWDEIVRQMEIIGLQELINFYDEHFENLNYSSMTLYSGPIEIDKRKKDACLYTGDYPMRLTHYIRDLKEFYNNYWDYIGTLQAPHHGAGRDNPRELYESYEHRTCVISAGSHNQFEHPNRETLINIINSRSNIRLVTENTQTLFIQEIDRR